MKDVCRRIPLIAVAAFVLALAVSGASRWSLELAKSRTLDLIARSPFMTPDFGSETGTGNSEAWIRSSAWSERIWVGLAEDSANLLPLALLPGEMGWVEHADAMEKLARHDHPRVRAIAVSSLRMIGGESAAESLEDRRREDPMPDIRELASLVQDRILLRLSDDGTGAPE